MERIGFFQRLALAGKMAFGLDKKSDSPFDSPRWGDSGSFSSNTFKSKGQQLNAYTKIEWVAIACDILLRDCARRPFCFYDSTGAEIIDDRRIADLVLPFRQGISDVSFGDIMEMMLSHMLLVGNGYIWKSVTTAYGQARGLVDTFIPLQPEWVHPRMMPNGLILSHYEVHFPGGTIQDLDPFDIIHFRQNTTKNLWCGIGNVTKMRLLAQGEVAMMEYQNEFMERKASPSIVITDTAHRMPEDIERIQQMIQSKWQGKQNAGKAFYMNGEGITVTPMMISQRDMQFLEIKSYDRQTILSIFGVPLSVAGIPDANYATAKHSWISYLTSTCNPILQSLENRINKSYVKLIDPNITFKIKKFTIGDVDDVIKQLQAGIITPNRAAELMGEEEDEIDIARESFYLPSTLIPISSGPAPEGVDGGGAIEMGPSLAGSSVDVQTTALNGTQVSAILAIVQNVVSGALSKEAAAAIIHAAFPLISPENIDAIVSTLVVNPTALAPQSAPAAPTGKGSEAIDIEAICEQFTKSATKPKQFQVQYIRAAHKSRGIVQDRFLGKISEFFEGQKKRVIKRLNSMQGKSLGMDSKDWMDDPDPAGFMYDLGEEAGEWEDTMKPLYTSGVSKAIFDINLITGARVNSQTSNPFVKTAIQNLGKRITGQKDGLGNHISMSDTDLSELRRIVQKGVDENWTTSQLQAGIEEKYTQWAGYRARMIANTEARAAWDAGAQVGYKELGVEFVDVVGCTQFEPDSDCGRQNIPIALVETLSFHPNHVGTLAPSQEIQP